jgi:hypothetical protein
MLSVALSMAVLTSSGGMLAEQMPHGVRLLDEPAQLPGLLLGAARGESPGISEYQSMSLPQLQEEWTRLEESKPGLGAGIAVTVVGGAAFLTGLILFFYGAALYAIGGSLGVFVVGMVLGIAGIVMLIVGPIMIGSAGRERRRVDREQEAVRHQIRLLEGGGSAPPLPMGPPPPPPPPPLSGVVGVEPRLIVAAF